MEVKVWTQRLAPRELLEQVERRRKEVFIDELGWPLQEVDGRERDQFDRPGTLLMVVGDVFAMRLLHEQRSMVRTLWPEWEGHITPGSWELSRWVGLRKAPLREMRAAVRAMARDLRARQMYHVFSVATNRIARSHRLMGMDPYREVRMGEDMLLCKWRLTSLNRDKPDWWDEGE